MTTKIKHTKWEKKTYNYKNKKIESRQIKLKMNNYKKKEDSVYNIGIYAYN